MPFTLLKMTIVLEHVFNLLITFFMHTAGKTTLLRILAGKHMVGGRDVVRVLNCSAFHDTHLVCSGNLAYLGESWSKTIGSAVSFHFMVYHLKCTIAVNVRIQNRELYPVILYLTP